MDRIADWARDKGLGAIRLETQSNNVAACSFYQRYGFVLGGYDRFLYRELGSDTAEEVASAQLREGSVLTFGQSDAEDEFRYVLRAAGTLSKDSDDSSCDGDNERERAWPPLLPPPSVPPPSMRASSSSPLVPPKLRTRPSGPRPLAFYAGAGISPASAPQQRRCVR